MNQSHPLPLLRLKCVCILFLFTLLSCYQEEVTYRLTVRAHGNGTVFPEGDTIVSNNKPEFIIAFPAEDWIFLQWEIISGFGCHIAEPQSTNTTVALTAVNSVIQGNFATSQAREGYYIEINQPYINESNDTALSFTLHDGEPGNTYYFSVDDDNSTTPAITGSGTTGTATTVVIGINVSTLDDSTLNVSLYCNDSSGSRGDIVYDTVTKDTLSPEGSFVINNDNENTVSSTVALHMSLSEAAEMRMGNTRGQLDESAWEPYDIEKEWTLVSGTGMKTVYGEFRDDAGNCYETSDTIQVLQKLIASDGLSGDRFGYSVAVSSDGRTIVVGAPDDDDNGYSSGSVYIYDGTNWGSETKILPADGAPSKRFGYSVAITPDGSVVAVGAPGIVTGSGSVYLYHGTNWGTETKIIASDGASDDYFGYCVATSADGSIIVVGAYGDDDNGSLSGSLYVFSGDNWSTETKILPGDGAAGDKFGYCVAVSSDGSTVVAGAYWDDDYGTYSGSIYVYDGTNWGAETKIIPSDGEIRDIFGSSVAISADNSTIVTGACRDNDNGANAGSVYIYNGTNWGVETKLMASDDGANDYFGTSVAVSADGSTVAVGAPKDVDNGIQTGSLYLYNGTNWGTERKIFSGDTTAGYFGNSVALTSDGTTVIVGAYGNSAVGDAAGAVYVIPLE